MSFNTNITFFSSFCIYLLSVQHSNLSFMCVCFPHKKDSFWNCLKKMELFLNSSNPFKKTSTKKHINIIFEFTLWMNSWLFFFIKSFKKKKDTLLIIKKIISSNKQKTFALIQRIRLNRKREVYKCLRYTVLVRQEREKKFQHSLTFQNGQLRN